MLMHENDTRDRPMHHGNNEHANAMRMMVDMDRDGLHHFVARPGYNLVRVTAVCLFMP